MKPPLITFATTVKTPVFKPTLNQFRPVKPAALPPAPKRDNIFSKSRDTREDRGVREMKTSHSTQSFPHAR